MKKIYLLLVISAFIRADRQDQAPQVINIFYDLPALETQRLVLRKVQPEDLNDLHEMYSDPEVVNYVACGLDASMEDTQKWLDWRLENAKQGRPVPWALVLKGTNEMIGLAGFCGLQIKTGMAELMIVIKRAHWNKGYAKEIITVILEYGFLQMGLNRIESTIHPDNNISIILHEKLGFTCVGLIPECKYYRGAYCDRLIFTL